MNKPGVIDVKAFDGEFFHVEEACLLKIHKLPGYEKLEGTEHPVLIKNISNYNHNITVFWHEHKQDIDRQFTFTVDDHINGNIDLIPMQIPT